MQSFGALIVIFILNSILAGNSVSVVSLDSKNVKDEEAIKKRGVSLESSDFFPNWVPFKNLHGDELGEFEHVTKRTPRKRLAPPFNYLLKSVADSESSDDYFDKSPGGGSEDDYEKSDWSDVNRDVIPTAHEPKLNHTDLTDIDGIVTNIQKPYVIHVARDENNTKLQDHHSTPSKPKNNKSYKTLDRQGKYDPYQETGPLKEIKRAKKKLYEEFDYDDIDKVSSHDNNRESRKVNIFKIEDLKKHSNGKRQTMRDAHNSNEDERLKELIESELFIVKKLYGKEDVLPFHDDSANFEEHGDMLVGKYDEQTTTTSTSPTTTTVRLMVKTTTTQNPRYNVDLNDQKEIQSVFENPSLYLENENENNTKIRTKTNKADEAKKEFILETIDNLKRKHQNDITSMERKETLDAIRRKVKARQEKAKNVGKVKHERRKYFVPDTDSKAGEPTLFFPSKNRHEHRKKKNKEFKKNDLSSSQPSSTTLADFNSPSNLRTTVSHTDMDSLSSETEPQSSQTGPSNVATGPSGSENEGTVTDTDIIQSEREPSSMSTKSSDPDKKLETTSLETGSGPTGSDSDSLSSDTGPSGSGGPSSKELDSSSLESDSSSSELESSSENKSSSSESDTSGPEKPSIQTKPSDLDTGPLSSETGPSALETSPSSPGTSNSEIARLAKSGNTQSLQNNSLKIEPLPWFSDDLSVDNSVGDSSAAGSRTHLDAVSAATENKKEEHSDGHSEKVNTDRIIEEYTTEAHPVATEIDIHKMKQKKVNVFRKHKKHKKSLKKSKTSTTESNEKSHINGLPESLQHQHNLEHGICNTTMCNKTNQRNQDSDKMHHNNNSSEYISYKNDTESLEDHTISEILQQINDEATTTLITLSLAINSKQITEQETETTTSQINETMEEINNILTTKSDKIPDKTERYRPKELINEMLTTNMEIQNLFQNESREHVVKDIKTNYTSFEQKSDEEMRKEILEKFNDINKSYNRILQNAFTQNDVNVMAIQKDIKQIKDLISQYDNIKKSSGLKSNETNSSTNESFTPGSKVDHASSGFVDIVVDKLHGVIKAANANNAPDNENKHYLSIDEQHKNIWEKLSNSLKRLSKLSPHNFDEKESNLGIAEDSNSSEPMPAPSLNNFYNSSKTQLLNTEYEESDTVLKKPPINNSAALHIEEIEHVKNHEHEKGGGKEAHSHDESEHGEHGKKAYESKHEDSKKSKGKHDKEDHLGKYEDHGGHDKHHHDESGHSGTHHHEEKGKKHAEYEESGKHSKGHSTKGSHDIHKKEEYEKNVEFFEEEGDSAEEEKHGSSGHENKHSKGGEFSSSNLKAGHDHHHSGLSGAHARGHLNRLHKGQRLTAGHDEHRARGRGSIEEDGKSWVYHHGNPAQTANFVVIDRRGDQWPVVYGR